MVGPPVLPVSFSRALSPGVSLSTLIASRGGDELFSCRRKYAKIHNTTLIAGDSAQRLTLMIRSDAHGNPKRQVLHRSGASTPAERASGR